MKNYKSYISALAVLTLASCDPMHDVYEELDKDKLPVNNKIEYTLTGDDYTNISKQALAIAENAADSALAKSIASKQAFNETFKAPEFVPALLTKMYPQLGFTSTAQVTYNVTENVSENVLKLEGLVNQPLVLADYQAVMGEGSDMDFFTPLYPAESNLAKAVAAKFADVTENGVYYTQYDYITSDPVKDGAMETLSTDDFEDAVITPSELTNWTVVTTQGEKKWIAKEYSGNKYAEVSAYKATSACESWLISPEYAIENGKNISFNFDIKIRFYNHGETPGLKVLVSDNYTDNVETATWTDVTASLNLPAKDQDPFVTSDNYDLKAYAGKNIRIAFVYNGDQVKTSTYQIDNLRIQENTISYINPVYTKEVLVERYNGNWSVYKFGTVVSADDYVTMGAKGSFKDQATANVLLPVFMGKTYPYAKEGDTRTVVYKVGSTQKVDEFVFTNGVFVLNNWIETVTEQYVQDGKKWIFDPSIKFDLSKDDYAIIIKWVQANKAPYMDPKYDNSEYYFGASSHYGNFNQTPVKLIEADERGDNEFAGNDMAKVMEARMKQCFAEVLLPVKYADLNLINGIDTYVTPSYIVYDGANTTYSMKFKLVGKGKFEYVEGPIKK